MAKILQGLVGRFITATFMIAGDKSGGCQATSRYNGFEKTLDGPALPNVGDGLRLRSATRKIRLVVIITRQRAIDGPSKVVPNPLSAAELGILPEWLFCGLKSFPPAFIPVGDDLFDVFMHLTATPITDLKGFTPIKNLLVEKTTVHSNDDRHAPTIASFLFKIDYFRFELVLGGIF